MKLRRLPVFAGTLIFAGCFGQESTPLVPESPFGQSAPPPQSLQRAAHSPASVETAARVDRVGRQILNANPQIGLKPLFVTIGAPQVELFHRGTHELTVTEGLVRQCGSDGQLAAVLCTELGKMVAEREALALPQTRQPARQPPADMRLAHDGMFNAPDLTAQAELARYDPPNPRRQATAPLPDPKELAKLYLTKAGYQSVEMDQAAPILNAAQASSSLEKQLTQPARPWTQ